MKLLLSYTGEGDIEGAVVTVSVPSPFQIAERSILVPTIGVAQKESLGGYTSLRST